MKTNIKMRVETPEQSKAIQEIALRENCSWGYDMDKNIKYEDKPYIFIEGKSLYYANKESVFKDDKNSEVDTDLFISTNGTCEETYKETCKDTECYDLTEFGYDRAVVDGILLEGNPQPNLEKYDNFTKADTNKSNLAILFDTGKGLSEVADVMQFGAKKYNRKNWSKVDDKERYISAPLRHMLAYSQGEKIDSESNKHHLAHAICSLLFLLEIELKEEK